LRGQGQCENKAANPAYVMDITDAPSRPDTTSCLCRGLLGVIIETTLAKTGIPGEDIPAFDNAHNHAKSQVSANVTWKNLGNSLVLLNLVDSTYYVLNETASSFFRGVLDGRTDQQIAERLVEEYECSIVQAFADVEETRDYLTKEGVLKGAEQTLP
jgi:hypothetical protein